MIESKHISILASYADYSVSLQEVADVIGEDKVNNKDYASEIMNHGLSSEKYEDVMAAIGMFKLYPVKDKFSLYFNQLLINPYHDKHQELTKDLQDRYRFESSVEVIDKILSEGFEFLDYTCSEDSVIAKWYSHALNDIGTESAIQIIRKHANSSNNSIMSEMRYRLSKNGHSLE